MFNKKRIVKNKTRVKRNHYILIYDIESDKKRNKLSKLLEGYGKRIQKSCFEMKLSKQELRALYKRIHHYEIEDDSVIIYKVFENEIIRFNKNENVTFEELSV